MINHPKDPNNRNDVVQKYFIRWNLIAGCRSADHHHNRIIINNIKRSEKNAFNKKDGSNQIQRETIFTKLYDISFLEKKIGNSNVPCSIFLGDCCAVHHNFMLPAITCPKCVKLRCLEVWSLIQGGVLTWAQITRSQYYKNTCTIYQYHKSWMDTLHYTSISSIREWK